MATDNETTTPGRKRTKTQKLEQEIAALKAEIVRLEGECRALGEALDSRDEKERGIIARAERSETKHKALLAACQPLVKATAKWKNWPNDHIAAIQPLTFGHIRTVREAAIANV